MSDHTSTRGAAHRIGLIGGSIGGSLSPALHEREAAALGLAYTYERLDIDDRGIRPGHSGELLRKAVAAGFTGFNVTHPCKQVLLGECDALTPDARVLGAVNTIVLESSTTYPEERVRLVGHNTDHSGFIAGLRSGLPDACLDRVAVVGAGGAGSAVAYALLATGARMVTVLDLDDDRLTGLSDRLARSFGPERVAARPVDGIDAVARSVDGVVNATPIGMDGHPGMPFDPSVLNRRHWVADVVYRPFETELLAAARATECRVLDGGAMLVAQAADTMAVLAGVTPDLARMRAHLAELIGPVQAASA